MSDLIRALAIATAISRLSAHPNLRTYATRRFQYVTRTTILRRHSQRVLTFRQISRQEQRERRRVVDGDLVVRQFRGGTFGVGQRNTYRLVVANHFQHRPTDEEVVTRSALPSFKPVLRSSVSRMYMMLDFSPRISTTVLAIASRRALSCVKET